MPAAHENSQAPQPLSIAVVVATHQGERHLHEQLDSLARQSLRPTSVIVSDAGSTDRTLQIAEEFAGRAPFPVVIRRQLPALGDGGHLLSAVLLATTDLVALCGQADVWLPSKLADVAAAFACDEVLLAVHTAITVDDRRHVLGRFQQGIAATRIAAPLTLDPWGSFAGFTMSFRRALLDMIAAERRGRDLDRPECLLRTEPWVYFLASSIGAVALLAEPLCLHRPVASARGGRLLARLARLRAALERQHTLARRSTARHALALERARILREAADCPSLRGGEGARLAEAARHWTRVARSEENRLALYHESTTEERFDKLLRNVADGTYRRVTDGAWLHTEIARDLLSLLVPP